MFPRIWVLTALLASAVGRADDGVPEAAVEPGDEKRPLALPELPAMLDGEETPSTDEPVDTVEPRARIRYSSFLAVRANPAGLGENLGFGWRHRLSKSESILLASSYVHLGIDTSITPANGAIGARVEVQPLAILNLSATYEGVGFFGTFGNIMTFDSTFADFSDDARAKRREAGENYATQGTRLTLAGILQAKVGPVFVRSTLSALRLDLDLRDGEELFYDATFDLLLPNQGWAVVNGLDVGAMVGKSILGARYTYADALHSGAGGPGDEPMHRVGPLFAYTFHDRPAGARFNRPTLLALVQWYASHPFRAGQSSHQAYPLIALALSFEGDLWTSRR